MKNIHMTLLKTLTIVVVVVCNSMCRSENTFNSDKIELHRTKYVAEELFKRITLNDVEAKMSTRPARHTPSYLVLLYNSLEEFQDLKQDHSGAYPKIRSFRGLKGVRNQKESLTTFPLSNVKWTEVTRVEVVIKLDLRDRKVINFDQATLHFYKESHEISNVGAQIYDSYLIFDVSVINETNRRSVTIDNSLVVGGRKLKISRRNEALLLIYEHLEQNPLLNESRRRIRRQTRHVESLLDITREPDAYSCRKYTWYIDMAAFDNFNWWLRPFDYNAGFCSGRCLFPLTTEGTNSTSYSFMKNIWHLQTFTMDDQVPKACCVPVDYDPLQILYLNNDFETDIMYISDMRVKSCGCR